MRTFAVVGRFTRTVYGPFASVSEADRWIREELRSSHRYYEVVLWTTEMSRSRRLAGKRYLRGQEAAL